MGDVVEFPKDKIFRVPLGQLKDPDVLKKNIDEHMEEFVDFVTENISYVINDSLEHHGICTEGDMFIRDMVIVSEFLKSMIQRTYNIHNDLQDRADEFAEQSEEKLQQFALSIAEAKEAKKKAIDPDEPPPLQFA